MKNDIINFEPVAGYTIKEAITKAISMARQNNKVVKATMNDIVIYINQESQVQSIFDLYQKLLNKRYKDIQTKGK